MTEHNISIKNQFLQKWNETDEEYEDDSLELILEWAEDNANAFLEDPCSDKLTESAQDRVHFSLRVFCEYMYSYFLEKPPQWEVPSLEEVCTEIVPRKVSSDPRFFQSFAPILMAVFQWAETKNILENTSPLIEKLAAIHPQIIENEANPRCWGMAKSMFRGSDYHLPHPVKSTFERSVPKPKRNEPCSCGSGKKYKKCCFKN
ncbi:MAG: SEC-C metal-binding domain-containing protein [Chlamydiota bacterium]